MAVVLTLRTDADGRVVSSLDGQTLAVTPRDALPPLARLQADGYNLGKSLFAALGGDALRQRLNSDGESLLLLDCDAEADAIAWEFAALPEHQFLVTRYGVLRLLESGRDDLAPTAPAPGGRPQASPIHFIALGADPLVDKDGNPRERGRLGIESELRGIRDALKNSGVALRAWRVPPTKAELNRALRQGAAILHLTCHGDVVKTDHGAEAMLVLEDNDGGEDWLYGRDLVTFAPRGALRFVLLSACRTAQAGDAHLARALVQSGAPLAVGMQSTFLDKLSEPFAVALYESMLAGYSFAEALRQARLALVESPDQLGLPVGYAARDGWLPLPLAEGHPQVGALGLPGDAALTSEVQPPRPLFGRYRELHDLARLYSSGNKVVTITGTGGMGKTALAASFAERFAWRWNAGVRTVSFASDVVDADAFRRALLRVLRGDALALQLADADAETQTRAILETMRDWDGLLLLDNYESVLQRLPSAERRTIESPASTDENPINRVRDMEINKCPRSW